MQTKTNKTQLNKFASQIDGNKSYLDGINVLRADDNKKLSMAVCLTTLREYLGLSQKEAYDALTDGGGDNKFDAFYYDDENDLSELVIVQSKYKQKSGETDTFSEDEIKATIKNCHDFLRGEDFQKASDNLKNKITAYRDLLRENDSPSISIKLYFTTNGIIHDGHKALREVLDC